MAEADPASAVALLANRRPPTVEELRATVSWLQALPSKKIDDGDGEDEPGDKPLAGQCHALCDVLQHLHRYAGELSSWTPAGSPAATASELKLAALVELQRDLLHDAEPLAAHMPVVLYAMLHLLVSTGSDADVVLAAAATSFLLRWLEECRHFDSAQAGPLLPYMLPALYANLRMRTEDMRRVEEEDRENQARNDAELKTIRSAGTNEKGAAASHSSDSAAASSAESPEKLIADDSSAADDAAGTRRTLRRESVVVIDALLFSSEVVVSELLLPLIAYDLRGGVGNEDWQLQERALRALSIIAHCFEPTSPEQLCREPLWTNILRCFSDEKTHVLVQQSACGALGAMAHGVYLHTRDQLQNDHARFYASLVRTLLAQLASPHARIQQAAAAGLDRLFEEAQYPAFDCYTLEALEALQAALAKADRCRNTRSALYDTLSALCKLSTPPLQEYDVSAKLLSALLPLLERPDFFPGEAAEVLTVLEDLTAALQGAIAPHSDRMLSHALFVARTALDDARGAEMDAKYGDPLVSALSLVCALLVAVGDVSVEAEALVDAHADELLDVLRQSLDHPIHPVRERTFAVLGDAASHCVDFLRPMLPRALPACVAALQQYERLLSPGDDRGTHGAFHDVANNAMWALGMLLGALAKEEVPSAVRVDALQCIHALWSRADGSLDYPSMLDDNIAFALGHLMRGDLPSLLPLLSPPVLVQWLKLLPGMALWSEKEVGLQGLVLVLHAHPPLVVLEWQGAVKALVVLLDRLYMDADANENALKTQLADFLRAIKRDASPGQWAQAWEAVDGDVAERLRENMEL